MKPQEFASAALKSRPVQAAADVQRTHPNAVLSTGSGTLATIVVWSATAMGLPMDAMAGAAFATALSAGALFVGRRGLKRVLRMAWDGDDIRDA